MERQEEIKRIERRAKALLINKEIPAPKMEMVRTLMNNSGITSEEKYRAIIDLIQNCPDKKVTLHDEEGALRSKRKIDLTRPETAEDRRPPASELFTPTETSYYIDAIFKRYNHLKLFRKRYLAHRNNRLGIGLRKRLIPSRNLLKFMGFISKYQEAVVKRLVIVLVEILNDKTIEDPRIFNYLRLMRKWMMEVPLLNARFDTVKWMERPHFEREFKDYIINFFSFLKMNGETREEMLLMVENKLRGLDELKKEEVGGTDSDSVRREKEKRNLAREREVYDYMMLLRSFLPSGAKEECILSKRLKQNYNISSFSEVLLMISEALVFQRPLKLDELSAYYNIDAPVVSQSKWDYSEEYLKKVGKDPASQQKKRREALRKELAPYETLVFLLKFNDKGQNILFNAIDAQWRHIDKKHYDPRIVYNENYFNFLDGIVHYFRNMYVPLLDGSSIIFRDKGREEHDGSIFAFTYFESFISTLNEIIDEMHFFRSNNPTLAITREEVKHIIAGKVESMNHAERFIRSVGDCFYSLAIELHRLFDLHKRWVFRGATLVNPDILRNPLKERDFDIDDESGRPIPYYESTIRSVENSTALTKELVGKEIISHTLEEGVFVTIAAFAYQVSYECMNERVLDDLEERKRLLREIEEAR